MKDILQEIIAHKRIEVAEQKKAVPLEALLKMGSGSLDRPVVSMRKALEASPAGIIAEFKRKSPSKGWLFPGAEVGEILPAYEANGASACSVLTDGTYFGGSLGDLKQARGLVGLPLLRKDFIVDAYQIYQARLFGADAILLIAAALDEAECRSFATTARSLGLEVLLEIHSEAELPCLNPDVDLLGVNNRHLGTFHTDAGHSLRLVDAIRKQTAKTGLAPLLISESGLSDASAVRQLRREGFRGFLIGETFMKAEDPGGRLSNFISELS